MSADSSPPPGDGWTLFTGDVAGQLGVSPKTVRRLADDGELPYRRIGTRGRRRFRATDVRAFLRQIETGERSA